MTDYQDNCAHTTAEQTEIVAHDLVHSSEPAGTEPTFQPIATGPAKTSDEALIRMADEVIDLARRERDAYTALADLDVSDPREAALTAEAKTLEATILDRFMMQALIRADTPAGLAAKGRGVLAYREMLETCEAPEIQQLLLSMADDAVRFGSAPLRPWMMSDQPKDPNDPDSALLTIGRHFELQWTQERIVAARGGSDEAIRIETDRTQDFVNRIRDLPATTPAGWHVKARAIAWSCSEDFRHGSLVDMSIVASLLHDLGAIERGNPSAPTLPDPDQLLLKYHAPFYAAWKAEREAAAIYDASGESAEASVAHDRAIDAMFEIARNIASFPAGSLDGVKLKVAALSSLYPDEDVTVECLTGHPGAASTDISLILDIVRDLRAMVGEPVVSVPPRASSATETLEQAA